MNVMKHFLTLVLLFVATATVSAQETVADAPNAASESAPSLRFGYVSYDAVLATMPEYAAAGEQLKVLKNQYEAEMKRAESEFNKKYEEFLEGQKSFPDIILQKRQSELQELMNKNIAFRQEALRLYAQAESDVYGKLRERITLVVSAIGREQKLAFVLNTDGNACPYVNETMGVDITEQVKSKLK